MCHNGKIPIHVNIIADFYKFRSRFVNDSGFWGAKNAVMAYFDTFMSEIFNKSLIVLMNVTVFNDLNIPMGYDVYLVGLVVFLLFYF